MRNWLDFVPPLRVRLTAFGCAVASTSACFSPSDPTQDTKGDDTSTADPETSAAPTSAAPEGTDAMADVSSDASSYASETSGDAVSTTDATDTSTGEPTTCLQGATPFGAPTSLRSLNGTTEDEAPWLAPDELTVYFSSMRDPGVGAFDLYRAVRDGLDAPFEPPVLLATSSTVSNDRRPVLTADGLTMYLDSNPPNSGTTDIMVAARPTLDAEFGAFAPVAGLNSDAYEHSVSISPDGEVLYYVVTPVDGTGDLYRATRQPGGEFGDAAPIGELNTASNEGFAVLSSDGLSIFFASDRANGVGAVDIWTARRTTIDDGFQQPTNVTELNTALFDAPSWLSDDGCRLYFFNRADDEDIFVAARTP